MTPNAETDASSPTTVDDRVGTVIADRYRIESVIGRGGMSTVYRASDEFLGRIVALKVFRADLADGEDLRRQRAEIQLLASLNHPTLVTLFDAIADETGRVSLVLELVEGRDLRGELVAGGMDAGITARIGADIAEALDYIHERGIVHRDMKPGNLLVPTRSPGDTGPRAKLADFGIARLVDGTRMTSTGSFLGTVAYLSPEQAVGDTVGPPSDVYSLGLVLLECLTGMRAFEGTALESVAARLSRDPGIPESLGREWCDVLSGMTRREPRDRSTAREANLALRSLAVPTGTSDSVPRGTRQFEATEPHTVVPDAAEPQRVVSDATERLDQPADPLEVTARYPVGALPADRGGHDGPVRDAKRSSSRRRTIFFLVVLIVVAASVWAVSAFGSGGPEEQPAVTYPTVEGDLGTHLE